MRTTPAQDFTAALGSIQQELAKLQAHAARNLGAIPQNVNWGHVGSANHLLAQLRELTAGI